jgi:predicted DNA-binding ribbon-helix-helix protein
MTAESATSESVDDHTGSPEGPVHRIVQAKGRRFSLRLESAYWAALDRAAAEQGVRVGKLVADIARDMPQDANLASHVRLFCLAEVDRKAALLEQSLAEQEARGGDTDVVGLVDALPIPALLVTAAGNVGHLNAGFGRWFGSGHAHLLGKPLEHFLKLRTQLPMEQVRRSFANRASGLALGHLMYVSPGKVAAAPCRIVPVQQRDHGHFALLIMLVEARRP